MDSDTVEITDKYLRTAIEIVKAHCTGQHVDYVFDKAIEVAKIMATADNTRALELVAQSVEQELKFRMV